MPGRRKTLIMGEVGFHWVWGLRFGVCDRAGSRSGFGTESGLTQCVMSGSVLDLGLGPVWSQILDFGFSGD